MAKLVKHLEKVEYVLMIAGILLATAILFVQIVLRLFSTSLPWIEEAARYLFVYFTWIGTSIAVTSDQHIRVGILDSKFPKAYRYVNLLCYVICLLMAVFMFRYGLQLILTMRKNSALSPTMKIPMWICYLAVPCGGLLITIKYVNKIILDIRSSFRKEGKE